MYILHICLRCFLSIPASGEVVSWRGRSSSHGARLQTPLHHVMVVPAAHDGT